MKNKHRNKHHDEKIIKMIVLGPERNDYCQL